jgi:hypothetical protein
MNTPLWVAAAVTAAGLVAQQGSQPNTARISGFVVSGSTGSPVRAMVSLVLHSGDAETRRMEMTDANGAFEFTELDGGRFTLNVTAVGHLRWSYGQRGYGERPAVHMLRRGEHLEASITLPALGAIAGRVVDPFGDPVPGVGVFLFNEQAVDGVGRWKPLVERGREAPAPRLTDDLGQFRLYGLMPGRYYMAALSGVLTASPLFNIPNETAGFAPTYYPGTPSLAEAQTITLGPSQEMTDVTIQVMPAPMRKISGVVLDSHGAPLSGAFMSLSPLDRGPVNLMVAGRAQARDDGTFTFSNVPQGAYILQGRSLGTTDAFNGEFGWITITIDTVDVAGVTVATNGPSVLKGRLVSADGEALPMNAIFGVQVAAPPVDIDKEPVIAISTTDPATNLDSEANFTVPSLWGRRYIRLRRAAEGWRLARITLDGKDVTDVPIDFTGRSHTTAEIVLTKDAASVTGRVVDRDGRGVAAVRVVVFSEEDDRWVPHSRFVATAAAGEDGTFRIGALPPGDYLAAIVPQEVIAPMNSAFLHSVRSAAIAVTLPAGEAAGVELKIRD